MARVNGPLMSMDASGSLGGTIVYSKWKGRPYVRQLVRPANPKSGGQVSMRAMLKFLSQNWAAIGTSTKDSWEDLADAGVYSNFNAFTKFNLRRHAEFLAPQKGAGGTPSDTPTLIDTFTATAGVRAITISVNDDATNDPAWGYLLYRHLDTGFTPAFDNLHAVLFANAATPVTFVDSGLKPDTYYYDVKPFTEDATIGALKGEINAEIT